MFEKGRNSKDEQTKSIEHNLKWDNMVRHQNIIIIIIIIIMNGRDPVCKTKNLMR